MYLADQKSKLPVSVKSVKIEYHHVTACKDLFNELVADTLERHKDSGLSLWQSCAMIEQCWGFFETDVPRESFQSWFFEQANNTRQIGM